MKKIIVITFILASIFTAWLLGTNLAWRDAYLVNYKHRSFYADGYKQAGYYYFEKCDQIKVRNFFGSVRIKYYSNGEWREFNFFAEKGNYLIKYK